MMEGELTCPVCLDLFKQPVVLPCSHNLCTTCARRILKPRGISQDWVNWVVENKSSCTKSHLQPDVRCPTCRQTFPVDPRGVAALQRNLILENVIERFKEERTTTRGSSYDQEPLVCQFCEDFSPRKANVMCSECTFAYCGTCFDTYHPMKGPLSGHTIGPPQIKTVKSKENNVTCQEHKEEKVALYCYECQKAVCYMCKEFGEHKKHRVELLEAVFRKTKDDMARILRHLVKHNNSTHKLIESFEGMCAVAKKSGSDVEAHVKKECDMLLVIIEKKKAELLEYINSAYNDKLNELHETIRRCDKTLQQSLGLVEFSEEALKENNAVTFLQTSSALTTRMRLMLDAIKDLPQVSSLDPTFDHMAVDTSWERKMLKKLDWLQEPGSPSFVTSQCKAQNRSVYLVWSQPNSAVDSYHLKAEIINPPLFPEGDELRDIVQVNTAATNTRYVIECSRYNAKVTARVKASNRAGDGPFSKELTLTAGKGLYFKLDPSSSPHRELVFSRDLTIAKLTKPVSSVVLGDVSLTTGRHYWKVRVDLFQGATNYSGYVAVGIARTAVQASLLGDHDGSYGLQVFENTSMWCENTHNRLQTKRKSKEFKGSNFAVLLDLDERKMNIYLNGKLQTDETRPKGPSFVGITGTFYPALCLYGTSVQTSIQSGLELPTRCPGIPTITLEDCSVDNTKINLAWNPPDNCNVDCYILEADILNREGDIHQKRMFIKVYQGPRCKYTIRGLEYNVTVVARVIAVNTAGQSEPSDEVSLSTERGVIFKLDPESIHDSLKLSRGNKTVVQHVATHANVFGDALLADGCHYWTVELQKLNPKNGFIAVGVARKPVQGVILGNDSSSFALQVFTETGVRTENTKNKIQLKKKANDIKGSIFGVLLDLNKEVLNVYLDGELQKTSTSPKGPSFKGLRGMFCAGLCLYGTNIEMSLTTGIETPSPPDAPAFNKDICKVTNTTVRFGWHPPPSKCPTDYYVLEVDVVKASEYVNKKKKDRKFKRVYEGPLQEHSISSVAYDMKIIGRVFGMNMAGEGTPSNDLVLSTPKGLYFQLDPATANHELNISENHCTVALKSPMYTFILGNVKLTTGCHYWRVHVDVFNSPNQLSIIGVGIARGILDDPILGEDTHSYAVQFNEHPTTTCINTKNRIQIKKTSDEMTNSNIGVLLNLDSRLLNIFFNGKLLTDNSRPSGPTFTGISGDFYPALSLYGTNVQLTVHTGESFETK